MKNTCCGKISLASGEEKHKEVFSVINELSATFSARAQKIDDSGNFAFDNFTALREAGLTALPIPVEHGGNGFDLGMACEVVRRLARACPATALGFCMHLMSLGSFVEYWKIRRDSSSILLMAIAQERLIVASAMSEGASAYFSPRSRISNNGDGLILYGKKNICSLSPIADLFAVSARQDENLVFTLVPKSSPGVTVNETWDALGMRATGSHSVDFNEVRISSKAVFHKVPIGSVDSMIVSGLVWFQASLAAVYLGLIEGAMNHTCDVLSTRITSMAGSAGARMITQEVGKHEQRRQLGEAAISRATQVWNSLGPTTAVLSAAVAAKNYVASVAAEIVGDQMSLVGGQSYARTAPLARLYRDAQAAKFHQLHSHLALELLGWRALGNDVRAISGMEGIS
jgi:alkylation response protein AidB-like acyl-CoA dehydrogenase